ncbi:hypothetical protein GCM10027569_23550 [Flindersiella endophytica]
MLAAAILLGLQWFVRHNATDQRFVVAMNVWLAIATSMLTIWLGLLWRGIATIRALPPPWRRDRAWWVRNLAAYVVLAIVAVFLLTLLQGKQILPVPVEGWRLLIAGFGVVGLTAAAPWVVLIWLAQEQAHRLRSSTEQIQPASVGDEWSAGQLDAEASSAAVASALAVWKAFQSCVLALAALLSMTALLNSALRVALLDAEIQRPEDFPPAAVLAYGLVAAILLAVAVLPLLLSYRAEAARLVERAIGTPVAGVPSQAWLDARARLQVRLNVEANLLRQASTTFSLLAPLVTAALAVAVPT